MQNQKIYPFALAGKGASYKFFYSDGDLFPTFPPAIPAAAEKSS